MMFPSPCGDYGSYLNRILISYVVPLYKVSVPLRGLWFLSTGIMTTITETMTSVSVPLRGLWFLSTEKVKTKVLIDPLFPSPCGDYGSYRDGDSEDTFCRLLKFPSPCGDYGSYH